MARADGANDGIGRSPCRTITVRPACPRALSIPSNASGTIAAHSDMSALTDFQGIMAQKEGSSSDQNVLTLTAFQVGPPGSRAKLRLHLGQ